MEYIFDLTEKDYLNFNMFTATNYVFYQKQKRHFCLIFTILPSVVCFSMKFFEGRNFPGLDVVFVFLVSIVPLTVLIRIFFPKLYDYLTFRNLKNVLPKEGRNNILGERRVVFEENKIRTITKFTESTTQYAAITEIKESKDAIYLYISPVAAIILPLRIFMNEAKKKEFMEFIYKKLNL